MKNNKLSPSIRIRGFVEAWTESTWVNVVNISTEMVNPASGIYDEWWHVGPGNIESFTGEILNNIKKVKDENLISNKFVFQPGDVIYSKIRPQLAKYAFPNFQGLASADAYVLTTKNGLIPEFLYLILHTSKFYKYSTSVSMRTGMPKINRQELNQYAFYIPSNEEQQKISELLKKINKIITFHQQELEALKQTKQGFLQKMFPKDGETIPEVRFSGFLEDWNDCLIGDVATVSMCKRIFKEQTSENGDIPFYKIGTFGKKPDSFISQELYLEYKNKYSYPDKGDILISASGTIGRTLIYDGQESYYQDSNIIWLKRKENKISNLFLYQFYKIVNWNQVEGSTIKRLYNETILSTRIKIPSMQEQIKIGTFFKQIDEVIELKEQELEALKKTKKGFLQKMFV